MGWLMFRITEGQYALGGLTVFAVWLFVILPLLHYFGDGWMTIVSTVVTATTGGMVAWFTIVLATVGKQQVADTRILQRAYLSVEPQGIEWLGLQQVFIGQLMFKNVGKLPATEFVSVVKKVEVHDANWVTPALTDAVAQIERVLGVAVEVWPHRFTIARYLRTGRSKLCPLNVMSCGRR
jgi:hypothetical protein